MEAKIIRQDSYVVSRNTTVPLSLIRATFAEWDGVFIALHGLVERVQDPALHFPGPLIDLLLERSATGVHRVANIMSLLAKAVQRAWVTQLEAYIVHGSGDMVDPIITERYDYNKEYIPVCVSAKSRESILYITRALQTIRVNRWRNQLPLNLVLEHTQMLDRVLPQDQYLFDRTVANIRSNVSEWMWTNVMTLDDVQDALNFLANHFLLRNGEFGLALVQEIEDLKMSRMIESTGYSSIIREQELNAALLRASLGTSAQHEQSLSKIRFRIPSGTLLPLLPLTGPENSTSDKIVFDDILLGTRIRLTYDITWPLDLFLHSTDLEIYADLFSFLSSLRHIHMRVHTCWSSLSNAQRARRQWTGLNDGGMQEDLDFRRDLLRRAWGTVRLMNWFLDVIFAYVVVEVVDFGFKHMMRDIRQKKGLKSSGYVVMHSPAEYIDFKTLRSLHTTYLDRLLSGCLLSNHSQRLTIRSILDVCEHFTAQVERWGGDVLPPLLFEGSINGHERVGVAIRDRWDILKELDVSLRDKLFQFYSQLLDSTSRDLTGPELPENFGLTQTIHSQREDGPIRRNMENLLLRLDFNGMFSSKMKRDKLNDGEAHSF